MKISPGKFFIVTPRRKKKTSSRGIEAAGTKCPRVTICWQNCSLHLHNHHHHHPCLRELFQNSNRQKDQIYNSLFSSLSWNWFASSLSSPFPSSFSTPLLSPSSPSPPHALPQKKSRFYSASVLHAAAAAKKAKGNKVFGATTESVCLSVCLCVCVCVFPLWRNSLLLKFLAARQRLISCNLLSLCFNRPKNVELRRIN